MIKKCQLKNPEHFPKWLQVNIKSEYISVTSHHQSLFEPKGRRRLRMEDLKSWKMRLGFAKMQIEKPQSSWQNVFWKNETKLKMSGNKSHQLFVVRTILWNKNS